jgi:hypothetical protein
MAPIDKKIEKDVNEGKIVHTVNSIGVLKMWISTRGSAFLPQGNHAHKHRSATVSFGRFLAERWSTPIWWRRARISI